MSTLLVVDDSKTAREVILQSLQGTDLFSQLLTASNGAVALEILQSKPVDVILCDLNMPIMGGFELLRELQQEKELRDIPFILLTTQNDQKEKISCLDLGACDYVTKPFDAAELKARLKVHLKLKILQDHLKEAAHTDPLTGLGNRRKLFDIIAMEKARALRSEKSLSLAMIDIDFFKKVNDEFGHTVGDIVLIEVAKTLALGIREYDLVARFGGEEFAAVFPETTLEQAAKISERLRENINNLSFSNELKDLQISISIGVATYPAADIDTINELIKEADHALYRAKEAGRNRVEIWKESTKKPE